MELIENPNRTAKSRRCSLAVMTLVQILLDVDARVLVQGNGICAPFCRRTATEVIGSNGPTYLFRLSLRRLTGDNVVEAWSP